jgi:hypothetical protein
MSSVRIYELLRPLGDRGEKIIRHAALEADSCQSNCVFGQRTCQSGRLRGYVCGDVAGSLAQLLLHVNASLPFVGGIVAHDNPDCGKCSADLPYAVMGTRLFSH